MYNVINEVKTDLCGLFFVFYRASCAHVVAAHAADVKAALYSALVIRALLDRAAAVVPLWKKK
ncbi:hypothetical protein [Negativicoccus succinicivorans]|uniref:hypothetical protein n=1 Tax=Negativicoccus succinicivorans TaxID=620903 RepID=UPI0028FEA83E|nr:hypothetical protein [Negativicoccus succinicivorans]MDU2417240.1 hypothetical protein [Negativicoccus succinicivorans]